MERHNIDFMLASSAVIENAVLVSNDSIFPIIQNLYRNFMHEN